MVPKFGGRDCEFSTTGISQDDRSIDSWTVTRRILREIPAAFATRGVTVWSRDARSQSTYGSGGWASAYSMDCLRNWTGAGQCYYADMGHFEAATATCLAPNSFAAQCLSTLLIAEQARRAAEEESENGEVYALTTSNADVLDPAISFGTHLNVQISTRLWEELLVDHRRPAVLGFVASALAAAIPFFGAGYLLPLKDGTTIYSLSARAHHISKLSTFSTTEAFGRGLLNERRESHVAEHERLHLIGFDFDVLSSALLFSLMQCVLAAAEEGYCGLGVLDPLRALRTWSWKLDPATGQMPAAVLMVDGRRLTLPAYMRELVHMLLRLCESGLITDEIAPQATQMLPRIVELACYLEEGSLVRCARHLGWAAKLLWLTQVCSEEGHRLGDADTRVADHDFCHTDPRKGAFWKLWDAGLVDPLVSLEDAEACLAEGPSESRDWARGRILARFFDQVASVDWSRVDLRTGEGYWSPRVRIELPSLDSLKREEFETIIESATDPQHLSELLEAHGNPAPSETDPVDDVPHNLAIVPTCGDTPQS